MDRDTWLQYFHNAPESVQDYLLDSASGEREDEARTELGLEHDAWDRVSDVAWELIFLKLPKAEFQASVKRVAGTRDPNLVERALLQYMVLPLADLVPWDVDQRLIELGVPLGMIQQTPRISLRPVSYRVAVRRVASMAKLSILSEDLVQRLRDVMVSYLRGVRTMEQFTAVLQRPSSGEGIGFTKSQAEAFTQALKEFKSTTQILPEEEFARWMQEEQQRAIEDRVQAEAVAQAQERARTRAQDEEADIQSTRAMSNIVRAQDSVERVVDACVTKFGALNLDEYLDRRLRNIVSARLRDVRNDIQTKAMLTREQKVGGLGFDEAKANEMAVIIEQTYNENHSTLKEQEQKKIAEATEAQRVRAEALRKQEAEQHAKWYEEKIKAQQASDPSALLKQAIAQSNAPVSVPVAPLTPRMDSVVPPPSDSRTGMLVGLADELARMTMQNFRRLAPDAKGSAKSILQKLEAMKADSFERWTEGVDAWRSSPVQQQYLRLITESFSAGKPVGELAEAQHAQDPNAPTPEEVSALIEVNTHIQFS